MEVKSIKNSFDKIENLGLKQIKRQDVPSVEEKQKSKDILELTDWQRSVVEIALKYLENKNQVENNHPLSQSRFKEIKTFKEALKELEELRKPKFKEEALNAQANIQPENIVGLFTE